MREIVVPGELSDESVALRAFGDHDAFFYCQAFRDDPELAAKLGMESDPSEEWFHRQLARASSQRAAGKEIEFAIVDSDPEKREFLGALLIHSFQWHHRRAEITAWVVQAARGQGTAQRAIALGLDWGFSDLGLIRVEATTAADNTPAQALARRLGFQREGMMRARNLERGSRVDLVIFGLLQEEWARRAASRL